MTRATFKQPPQYRLLTCLIPFCVGSLLFLAASLKTHRLFTIPLNHATLLEAPWLQASLVAIELATALMLFLSFFPAVTRVWAIFLFATFFAVACFQALKGANSCACFGTINFAPWLAAALDLLVVISLLHWKPSGQTASHRNRPSLTATSALLFFILFTAIGFSSFQTLVTAAVLNLSPPLLDLGSVPKGAVTSFQLHLRNPTPSPIAVTKLLASCPCLESPTLPWELQPNEEKDIPLTLNLAKEPDYSGSLYLTIKGFTTDHKPVFNTAVNVRVLSNGQFGS